MRLNKINIVNHILIILFCTTRFWGGNLPWYINLIVRIFYIILFLFLNRMKLNVSKKCFKIFLYTIFPILSIMIYTLGLWGYTGNIPSTSVIRNLFTSNIYIIISVLFGALVYQKYKDDTVDLFVNCGFISYIIGSIIPLIILFPSECLKYLFTAYSANYDLLYYTEVNDLTFAMGFCFLYYLFFDSRSINYKFKYLLKCFFMIFWGLKRIEIFALILTILFYKIVISKFNIRISSSIATGIILFISFFYIMFIHNSELIEIAAKYNINFMGRLTTYVYVASHFSQFDIRFPGIGFGFIDEILEGLEKMNFKIGYIPIISLHSDILRMYIGIGFIAFGFWVIYQCFIKTRLIKRNINLNCAKGYLMFTVYLFVLYLTDNTYSYPVTFTLYIICTLCCCMQRIDG